MLWISNIVSARIFGLSKCLIYFLIYYEVNNGFFVKNALEVEFFFMKNQQ